MTKQHPLTDDHISEIFDHDVDLNDQMRLAYDRGRDDQLKEAQALLEDFLEKFSWRYSWQATYEVKAFVNNFKSYMRPQQQEDN